MSNEQFRNVIDRARGNLSMVDFANKCGISFSTLYRWLRGNQKTALRNDVVNKIYKAAAPESGLTENEIYRASISSINGDSQWRFKQKEKNDKITSVFRNCARDMFFTKGVSLREISCDQLDQKSIFERPCKAIDYALDVNDEITAVFYLYIPNAEAYHSSNNYWWQYPVNVSIGRQFTEKHHSNVMSYVVFAAERPEEAERIRETLAAINNNRLTELDLAFIVLDVTQEKFVYDSTFDEANATYV